MGDPTWGAGRNRGKLYDRKKEEVVVCFSSYSEIAFLVLVILEAKAELVKLSDDLHHLLSYTYLSQKIARVKRLIFILYIFKRLCHIQSSPFWCLFSQRAF